MRLWNISLYLDCDELGSEYEKVFNNHVAYLNYYLSLGIRKKKIEFDVCNTIGIYAGYQASTPVLNRVPKDILQIGVDFDKERYERIKGTSDCSYYGELIVNGLQKLESKYAYIAEAAKEIISNFIAGGCIVEKKFKSVSDKNFGIRVQFDHCITTNDYTLRARFVDIATKKIICEGAIIRTIPQTYYWQGNINSMVIEDSHIVLINTFNNRIIRIDLRLIRNGQFNYQFCEDWITNNPGPLQKYDEIKRMQWIGDISKNANTSLSKTCEAQENGRLNKISVYTDKSLKYNDKWLLSYLDYDVACVWQFVCARLKETIIECEDFSEIEVVVGVNKYPRIECREQKKTLVIRVDYNEDLYTAVRDSGEPLAYCIEILLAGINKLDKKYKTIKEFVNESLCVFLKEGGRFNRKIQEFKIGNIDARFYLVCDSNLFSVKGVFTNRDTNSILCEGNFISTLPGSDLIPSLIKDIVLEGDRIYIRNIDNHNLFYADCNMIREGTFSSVFCESPYRDDLNTRKWYNTIGCLKEYNILYEIDSRRRMRSK